MRQRLFPLSDLGKKGMAPVKGVNLPFWNLLHNCCTNGVGIEDLRTIIPIPAPEAVQSYAIGSDIVHFSATKFYDYLFSTLLSFSAGIRRWSCANFNLFALFSDGTRTIYRDCLGNFSTVVSGSIANVGTIPQGNCICDCNGQAIVGGLSYWPGVSVVDDTMVGWSKIGSSDFTLGMDNTSGYKGCEIGTIFFAKKLDKNVVLYGTKGVHVMYPAGVTFGHKTLINVPIEDERNVTGDEFRHIFRTTDGDIYSIDGIDKPLNLLGYKQFFADTPLSMSYNSIRGEAYITYTDGTYVIDKFGLFKTNLCIDSAYDNTLVSSVSTTQDEIRLETALTNFGIAGLKQISEVMLHLVEGTNVKVYVKVGSNTSPEIPINDVNSAKPFVCGDQVSIGICADFDTFNLSGLNVQTINVDGRFGQGVSL